MLSNSTHCVRLLSFIICFLNVSLSYAQSTKNDDSATVRNFAINAVASLDKNNHYTDFLTPNDLNELPVGLKHTINNITYKIAISREILQINGAITRIAQNSSILPTERNWMLLWIGDFSASELKEFCPYHIKISIDLTDRGAGNNPVLDMGTIKNFFSDELKRIYICRLVSRMVSDIGMKIECYSEENEPMEQFLRKVSLAENRFVYFTYKIDYDTEWRQVNQLLSL